MRLGDSYAISNFHVYIVTMYLTLTHCMNVSYVVGQERGSNILIQCIVSILRILIIF
jgi:hypothetical protein